MTAVTLPGTGAAIAVDTVAAEQHQLMKIEFGAAGSATMVSATNPLPVSAAALPLPTGAATDAVLTGGAQKTQVSVLPPNVTTGPTSITAVDAVVAAPVGDGTLVSGASTAGSVVAAAVPAGHIAWTLLAKAIPAGMTLYSEASTNSTNGTDGDWVEVKGRRTGTAPGVESVVYAYTAAGYYRGNAAGFAYFRIRALGTFAAGCTVTILTSVGQGATFLNSGIPAGSSTIGNVGGTGVAGTPAGGVVSIQGVAGGTALPVSGTFFQATQPVSGSFFQATQPVSMATAPTTPVTGTFFQATQPVSATALPLPAGAATLAKQPTLGTAGVASADVLSMQGIAGGTALPVSGTFFQATQPVSLATNTPDVTDRSGRLLGQVTNAGTFAVQASATQLPAALGGTTSAASLPVALATDTASGNITTQNLVPAGVATAGSAVEITLNGASSIAAQATGTYTGALSLQVTVNGTTWVTVGGTPLVDVSTGGYLASITSALQSVLQADSGGFTKARLTALAAVTGTATVTIRSSANPSMVALDAALPTGTNTIGNVTLTSGAVTTPTSATTTSATLSSAATTNATSVKASAGNLYSVTASNVGAAAAFLKIFNLAAAPTVGTSVPFLTIPIAASGIANIQFGAQGFRMATGISFAITNLVADSDTTAVAAAQIKVAVAYI